MHVHGESYFLNIAFGKGDQDPVSTIDPTLFFGPLLLQSTMLPCSREEHALAIRRMTRISKVSLFHVVRITTMRF